MAGQDSLPIPNAVVEVINTATGQLWRVETSDAGRYFFGTVTIGGPYRVAVRAVGFVPAVRAGVMLNAGQRYVADFFLAPTVAVLPEVTVQGTTNPQANLGRTGPAQLISDSALNQLPDLSREVVDLAFMSPQASRSPNGELAIGGQNPRYTTYLVDGGQNTDLYFGGFVARLGLQRSISPEAVAEVQVLAAPADVRNGDFAGGAVDIVTRSGTNEWHGGVFGFFQSDALVANAAAGAPPPDNFTTPQFGLTLSGPIVKNRLQFFLNADLQRYVAPDEGPFVTSATGSADNRIGIQYQSIARFDSILTHTYGLETGGTGRSDTRQPASDLFVKLSAQAGANNQLELSDHYARTNAQFGPGRGYGYYGLGSMASENTATANTLRLTWRGLFGRRWSNEMSLGYLWTQFEDPSAERALINVPADSGYVEASPWDAGGYRFVLSTSTVEFTDNATVGLGSHVVTLGTHNELLQFQDNTFPSSGGYWSFGSLDSLAAGQPNFYDTRLPGPLAPLGPDVNFRAPQLGLYAQDQWAITRQVMLTYGLRMDVPFLPDAGALNPVLRDSLGLETGQLPSGNPLWSPRLGVNYDIGGRGMTFLRGSVGLFSGHPAYRWIANGYHDSGGEQLQLTCDGADAPHFDPFNPPTTCGTGAVAVPLITVFDRDLKYPQNWKFALGMDQRLPWGLVATADLLYTYWVNQLYFTDANLTPPIGTAPGEGGRLLYGTIDSLGRGTPSRINPAFGPVVRVSNRSGDKAFLASLQLQREFGSGFGLSASYTYTNAEDLFSLSRFNSPSILGDTPLDGSLADRQLTTSFFSVPHRVAITASVGLPLRSRFSLVYQGSSQGPYTYVVQGSNNGDVNADGINVGGSEFGAGGEDIVYVPLDVRPGGDISLVKLDAATGAFVPAPASEYASLDKFITDEQCLDRQRGRIMARNSCRNAWYGEIDARLAVEIPTVRGQSIQLTADVANLPALLHLPDLSPIWAPTYGAISLGEPTVPLLELQGYDTVKQRGIYSLALPIRTSEGQAWNMQLGLRCSF